MAFLRANDALSGTEGRAFITLNGNVEELFYGKSIEATAEKNKAEMKVIGNRATQNKANGWKGTFTLNIYYATPLFRRMMIDYIKTGKDVYFDLQVVNEDNSSTIGKQTVVLKRCNIDSVILAKLDSDADFLDEEVSGTFEDVDMLDEFRMPTQV